MSPLRLSFLLFVFALAVGSTHGAKFFRYVWPTDACFPAGGFLSETVYCRLEGPLMDAPNYCFCDNRTNELVLRTPMNATRNNETGEVTVGYWDEVSRKPLGGCVLRTMYVIDTPGVCGPTIEDVRSFGKPFDAASYAQYAKSGTSGNSTRKSVTLPLLVLSLLFSVCFM